MNVCVAAGEAPYLGVHVPVRGQFIRWFKRRDGQILSAVEHQAITAVRVPKHRALVLQFHVRLAISLVEFHRVQSELKIFSVRLNQEAAVPTRFQEEIVKCSTQRKTTQTYVAYTEQNNDFSSFDR